jgi:hypothetical protein
MAEISPLRRRMIEDMTVRNLSPAMQERIAYAREPSKLPIVLSADEVVRFLEAIPTLKSRTALTKVYAAGLRVPEVQPKAVMFPTTPIRLRLRCFKCSDILASTHHLVASVAPSEIEDSRLIPKPEFLEHLNVVSVIPFCSCEIHRLQ